MKIALICPANMLYMPYVRNYEDILKEEGVAYDILNWDRIQMEEDREQTYRDIKIGHQRGFFDYVKYRRFIIDRLNTVGYDKVIVFGIQLTYFLRDILMEKFNRKFIVDIRDYHRLVKIADMGKLIQTSEFTVLSSAGYKDWLPKTNKYVTNHNIQLTGLDEMRREEEFNREKINISVIGALRDFKMNRKFIDSLKNDNKFQLNYYGEGEMNNALVAYADANNINNTLVTGRYYFEEEEEFYQSSNLINVLRFNDGVNNRTALPNRLYKATLYGKPLLAFEGSYLSSQIAKYRLGIVIDSFDNIENSIMDYVKSFDAHVYNNGREEFFTKVIEENIIFKNNLLKFLVSP